MEQGIKTLARPEKSGCCCFLCPVRVFSGASENEIWSWIFRGMAAFPYPPFVLLTYSKYGGWE